jgi:hypothetical protein
MSTESEPPNPETIHTEIAFIEGTSSFRVFGDPSAAQRHSCRRIW